MAVLTMKQVTGFLRQRGVSPQMTEAIRLAFIQDAVQNGKDIQADRIYTMLALSLHDVSGFGAKRIIKVLERFDYYSSIPQEELDWPELMKQLREKTGLVVQSNTEDRIVFEYIPEEMKKKGGE